MNAIEGVLHGREIGPDGVARAIGLAECAEPCAGWRLLALGRDSLAARSWLKGPHGIGEGPVGAMLAEDTRPRFSALEDGALLILRGPALSADGALQDMVSVRLFVTAARLVVVQRRALPVFDEAVAALDRGEGVESVGAFIVSLAGRLRTAVEPVLDRVQQQVDAFELEALERERPPSARDRAALNEARHDAILMRRHLAPQADALRALAAARPVWLEGRALRAAIKEDADAFRRIAEDLDAVRARAVVVSDEAGLRVAEQTNRLLLRLSAVSMVFLPLTFLTGLVGANLQGIPFAQADWSFPAFVAACVGLGGLMVWGLHRLRLL